MRRRRVTKLGTIEKYAPYFIGPEGRVLVSRKELIDIFDCKMVTVDIAIRSYREKNGLLNKHQLYRKYNV